MRLLLLAAATILSPVLANAADLDLGPLRGTDYGESDLAPVANWSGVYVGGFGGYAQSHFNSRYGVRDLIANDFRATTVENEHAISNLLNLRGKNGSDTAFGGFAGYNYQMDEVVIGLEADYTSAHLKGTSQDSIARSMSTSDGFANYVSLTGLGTTELKDYGTVRVRVGYTIGNLMPYVTGGVAIGRIESTSSVGIQYAAYNVSQNSAYVSDPTKNPYPATVGYASFNPGSPSASYCAAATGLSCFAPAYTLSKSKSTVAVGYTAGAGAELMLTSNIFLRGEYQFAFFDDGDGHKVNVNAVRGGAGVKF